jgi:DNA-binding NarL/FixJ family response regulator
MFRSGVSSVVGREKDFSISEAASLEELLDAVGRTEPDVALIDLDLPPRGGIEAVRQLAVNGGPATILWSSAPDRETVLQAIRAGASGFLDKELPPIGLVRCLRAMRSGEAPLSRLIAAQLIEALHGLDERERVEARARRLSSRELQVLALVSGGARNKEIAKALFISEFTVKRHVQNIFQKLEVPSRSAAAEFYRAVFEAMPAAAGEEDDAAQRPANQLRVVLVRGPKMVPAGRFRSAGPGG